MLYWTHATFFIHSCLLSIDEAYSHLFNKRGAWNKRGGGAQVAKSINVERGINGGGGVFGKKLGRKT